MASPFLPQPCTPAALRPANIREARFVFPKFLAACAVVLMLGLAPERAFADGDAERGDPKRGNEVFQQYCSGCHGPEGRGSKKSGFMPRPKNLTKKGYTELLPDEYLFGVIAKGGQSVNKSEYMPAFEGTISKEDIDNVIAFIRTLVLH